MASVQRHQKTNQSLAGLMEKNDLHDKEYIKEYIHIVSLALVFCALIAIITYNPSDASPFNLNSQMQNLTYRTTNTFGPLGATVADWSFQLFGIGAILFLLVFIAQLLNTFRRPKQKSRFYLRIFGYPQLIVCYLALSTAIATTIHFRGVNIYTGGLIGFSVFHWLQNFLGKPGATIALCIGFLSSFTLALGIRPLSSIFWLISLLPFGKLKDFAQSVKEISLSEKNEDNPPIADTVIQREPQRESETSKKAFYNSNTEAQFDISPPRDFTYGLSNTQPFVKPNDFNSLLELLDYHRSSTIKKNHELENQKLRQEALLIEEKLATFGVMGAVQKSQPGPVINVHEFEPASGVKVNKILVLQDDLALALKAQSLLINLQPGKSTLSIEVPAATREVVSLREVLESPQFQNQNAPLPVVLGKNIDGSPLVTDLSTMPHILVAGSTGSGKSVCINTMILSLLLSKTPRQLRLILIDPKMLELSNYNGIGHLLMPVVTDPEKAAGALKWVIQEMERRYLLMKNAQVRNIMAYNTAIEIENSTQNSEPLPYIAVIVDELCDLMMTAPKDVEDSIQRLAQKARAAGIHLILATQRPSVDVLTGVIKANLPCRLSFQVASRHDSRTIIENIGAERLLGKGDMLFLPPGLSKVTRAQCAFVNDKEINSVSDKLRTLYPALYENDIMRDIERVSLDIKQKNEKNKESNYSAQNVDSDALDENSLFEKALEFALEAGNVSTSSIQREFRIGYNRAARIMDRMIREGLVGQSEAAGKPRPVIKFKG
ncbi:MAG: DNA translocase FtsK 4TM domain-containing protein [Bdellovibrionota bacterium]